MRILHVSWEYPPLVYGGLGRHVHALAEAQAANGHDVTVLTQQGPGAIERERVNGVEVVRVTPPTPTVPRDDVDEMIDWVDKLDASMAEVGARLATELEPDIVHAHDWVVGQAAETIRRHWSGPLLVTVHATEAGRHQGWITNYISRRIHAIEYVLTAQAQRVIACSTAMRTEIEKVFAVPAGCVDVIANGIDLARWRVSSEAKVAAREQWAPSAIPAFQNLIVFVGRLEWEKGVHTLLDAAAILQSAHPDHRVVIAGTGTYEAALHQHANERVSDGAVHFAGWLPESELQALAAAADVVVVPSLYEPFGLVALEAGALGVPLVVARTGGLGDIVTDGVTGRVFPAGDAQTLAAAIADILADPAAAKAMAANLTALLHERYDWRTIANETTQTYARAITESISNPRPLEVAAPVIKPGNLFDSA